jgi:hypothetical protein
MATLKEEILDLVFKRSGLTDREITDRLRGRNSAQQPINQSCRQLEASGAIKRSRRHDGLIGNYPSGRKLLNRKPLSTTTKDIQPRRTEKEGLSEDAIKTSLGLGWSSRVGQ